MSELNIISSGTGCFWKKSTWWPKTSTGRILHRSLVLWEALIEKLILLQAHRRNAHSCRKRREKHGLLCSQWTYTCVTEASMLMNWWEFCTRVPGSWWWDPACFKFVNNVINILGCKVLLETRKQDKWGEKQHSALFFIANCLRTS